MSFMEFNLTQPCSTCPFRCDIKPFLNQARAHGIALSLQSHTFACHNTTHATKPRPRGVNGRFSKRLEEHCAGAMILMLNADTLGGLQQVAYRLGLVDLDQYKLDAPVFASFEAFIAAQDDEGQRIRLPRRIWYKFKSQSRTECENAASNGLKSVFSAEK